MIILKIVQAVRSQQITSRLSCLVLKQHICTTINRNDANRMNVISSAMVLEKHSHRLRAKDKMTKDDSIVFKSTIANAMTWAYRCSFFVLITLVSGIRHLWVEEMEYPRQLLGEENKRFTIYSELSMWLLYTIAIIYNIFCCLLIRRIAIRIWHNRKNNTYTMIFPSLLPSNIRQSKVKAGDVKPRYRFSTTTFVRSWHSKNGTKYYIPENNFISPTKYYEFIDESS